MIRIKKITLSPYNVNYDYKNEEHIRFLMEPLKAGVKLPITCYEEGDYLKAIDGGHTLETCKRLGLDPWNACNIVILNFNSDIEKIAYSRKKNANRLQRNPVQYTKSLLKELQLRFNKNEKEIIEILKYAYVLKDHIITTNKVNHYTSVANIFKKEPVSLATFTFRYIPYLKCPKWLKDMVQKGEIKGISHACLINKTDIRKVCTEEQQKMIAKECIEKSRKEVERIIDKYYNVYYWSNYIPDSIKELEAGNITINQALNRIKELGLGKRKRRRAQKRFKFKKPKIQSSVKQYIIDEIKELRKRKAKQYYLEINFEGLVMDDEAEVMSFYILKEDVKTIYSRLIEEGLNFQEMILPLLQRWSERKIDHFDLS